MKRRGSQSTPCPASEPFFSFIPPDCCPRSSHLVSSHSSSPEARQNHFGHHVPGGTQAWRGQDRTGRINRRASFPLRCSVAGAYVVVVPSWLQAKSGADGLHVCGVSPFSPPVSCLLVAARRVEMNATGKVLRERDSVSLLFFARLLSMLFTNINVVRSTLLCCQRVSASQNRRPDAFAISNEKAWCPGVVVVFLAGKRRYV